MPRQVIARVFLICAVLLAQQTALAHDLWHAAKGEVSQPSQKGVKLCDLHDLLGTVLGAVSGASPQAELLSFSESEFTVAASSAPQLRPLVLRSRGPPQAS
jgi:Na+(H+)/acetate symporter ActP